MNLLLLILNQKYLMEKYIRTTGNAKDWLYCYNFCLDSNQNEYQPSGAMNMNKFKYVQFEYNTIEPPIDPSANVINICDANGNIIGVRKSTTDLYITHLTNYQRM